MISFLKVIFQNRVVLWTLTKNDFKQRYLGGFLDIACASGIEYLNTQGIKYNKLLLCNDSIYFPLYNPRTMFEKMDNLEYDVLGITDNYEKNIIYKVTSLSLMKILSIASFGRIFGMF